MTTALGRQLIVEYTGCAASLLGDVAHVRRAMVEAAEASGATVVADSFHRFEPHGVSGVVVIAESHLTIHTWPERGYAAVDVFTCGARVDPWKAHASLARSLGAARGDARELARGPSTVAEG